MYSKEEAKKIIAALIAKYEKVGAEGKLKDYSEAETQRGFIEPLFKALGWDIENREEVSLEETISKKRADYGFRINGAPQFYLEAKPLKADLENINYAYQVINYAWTMDCTWAVLTDFEGLKIYNAEWKAKQPKDQLFLPFKYTDYLDRFDDLWHLSKAAFQEHALDTLAERYGGKTKRANITSQIFNDFMAWRLLLTKNIAKNKNALDEETLDEAVQRLLDRLIFIRVCEDRKIEPESLRQDFRLWQANKKGRSLSSILAEKFRKFDKIYNSKLFAPHLCETLRIDEDVLEQIIDELYEKVENGTPIHHYDFSIIESDVLGNIYEQYLGHILRKTAQRATLSEKKQHRKEMGIFYTPTYIVDYIVKNTIGEKTKGLEISHLTKIKILDPACGSGSFLIKAFDQLVGTYRNKLKNENLWLIKSEILTKNIYGVDLDEKAVEITQLNLLLKALEKRELLPDLSDNIKCGNSLISNSLNYKKNFVWNDEFKKVFDAGKFDVVVGNPPYVRQEELSPYKKLLESYETYHSMADLYVYFFEKGMKVLKEDGLLGFIVSNKFLKAGYGKNLRKFLSQYHICEFIDFGDLQVFKDATTYPCIIILKHRKELNPKIKVTKVLTLDFDSLTNYVQQNSFLVNQNSLDNENGWNFETSQTSALIERIKANTTPLKDYLKNQIYWGIKTGLGKAFVIDGSTKNQLIAEDPKSTEIIKPFLSGREIRRYSIIQPSEYVIFTRRGIDIERYQAVKKHLEKFRQELTPKKSAEQKIGRKPGPYMWYEIQDSVAYYKEFEKPKIIFGIMTTQPRFTLDYDGYYANNANFIIPLEDKHLLGILNSKMGWYLVSRICTQIRGGYQLIWQYFGNFPVPKARDPKIEKLVEIMLELAQKIAALRDKETDEKRKAEKVFQTVDSTS